MSLIVPMSDKFFATLPAEVVKALKVEASFRVVFVIEANGTVFIKALPLKAAKSIRAGMLIAES